ncbi:MAG: hypothetical protein J4428_05040 [Candidatus Aenigmarchaeota archaeon]|nr:hypothetical protein [Candidatus Aenigmarchaeota archaeon]
MRYNLLITIIVIVLITQAFFLFLMNYKKMNLNFRPSNEIKIKDYMPNEKNDLLTQKNIQNVLGYNWIELIKSGNNSEQAKLSSLLYLYKETNRTDVYFNYVKKSFGISKTEWNELRLASIDTRNLTKQNTVRSIDNLIKINKFFKEKGLDTSVTTNRLNFLMQFINKYGLPQGRITSNYRDVVYEVVNIRVTDYSDLVRLLLTKSGDFVKRV